MQRICFWINEADIKGLCERINTQLSERAAQLMGADHGIPLGLSMGAVMVPEYGRDYDSLFAFADNSLYYKNYTILVHALKSSARIIGALDLGEEAQKLELAGKSGDIEVIRHYHDRFMAHYQGYGDALKDLSNPKRTVRINLRRIRNRSNVHWRMYCRLPVRWIASPLTAFLRKCQLIPCRPSRQSCGRN